MKKFLFIIVIAIFLIGCGGFAHQTAIVGKDKINKHAFLWCKIGCLIYGKNHLKSFTVHGNYVAYLGDSCEKECIAKVYKK